MRSNRYIKKYSSPRTSRSACLCEDRDTYSRKCCKGKLINQGIGNVGSQPQTEFYLLKEDGGYLQQENSGKIIIEQ